MIRAGLTLLPLLPVAATSSGFALGDQPWSPAAPPPGRPPPTGGDRAAPPAAAHAPALEGPPAPAPCSVVARVASPICSAVGFARRQLCSAKGVGSSLWSVIQNPDVCSVVNVGAPDRSFCSTKFNPPIQAKACSTFSVNSECSVEGKGVCTTFGQALQGSCSAFVLPSHCSVIGGVAGDPCVQ